MPDLTKVLTRTCPSNFHWSLEVSSSRDASTKYNLSYDWKQGYTCSCPGFIHRGWCKHVRDRNLIMQHCGGMADAFANAIYEDETCPDCGQPTQAFYVGV